MTAPSDRAGGRVQLPSRPRPSLLMLALWVGVIVFTVLTARRVGFTFAGIIEDLQRPNPVFDGLLDAAWGEMLSERSRRAFLETLWREIQVSRAPGRRRKARPDPP